MAAFSDRHLEPEKAETRFGVTSLAFQKVSLLLIFFNMVVSTVLSSDESARFLTLWPGFDFWTLHYLQVEFYVDARPYSEDILGSPVFLSPS